uniref:Uncharacterized protein n=1 Tax=Trypanosoma congolense (strain IL3000) TaxID=1068625 RepID=G0USW4_TRYCI|nr:hypothetical protein, unlikely [Trypanosoma congolense IL3000]
MHTQIDTCGASAFPGREDLKEEEKRKEEEKKKQYRMLDTTTNRFFIMHKGSRKASKLGASLYIFIYIHSRLFVCLFLFRCLRTVQALCANRLREFVCLCGCSLHFSARLPRVLYYSTHLIYLLFYFYFLACLFVL